MTKYITKYIQLEVYHTVKWASYHIRKIAGGACAGNAGNLSPPTGLQRKPLVSDPGMPHGSCVTHVPWCMSGSLTPGGGENVPGILGACATRNFTYLARGPCYSLWATPPITSSLLCILQRLHVRIIKLGNCLVHQKFSMEQLSARGSPIGIESGINHAVWLIVNCTSIQKKRLMMWKISSHGILTDWSI